RAHLELHGVGVALEQLQVLVAKLRVPAVDAAVLHLEAELALVDEGAPLGGLRQLAVPGQAAPALAEVAVVDQVVADLPGRRLAGDRGAARAAAAGRGRAVLAGDGKDGARDGGQRRGYPHVAEKSTPASARTSRGKRGRQPAGAGLIRSRTGHL